MYFWLPQWVERDYDRFKKIHAELCARDEWIIDGSQVRTIPHRVVAADLVIFLDMPRRVCLWRIFKRWWQWRFYRRADLADGCQERLSFKFFWYVWCYQKKYRPRVIAALEHADRKVPVIIMHSAGEVADFLARW
ncbi:topology modulation protein [bacterium]|nr:MAG: topology modulation protein [bacterium]